jgi:ABC-2 type transport system permease protein
VKSIALRIIKQIVHDKRSLGLIFLVPIFLLTLLYFLLGESDYTPVIAAEEPLPPQLTEALEKDGSVELLSSGGGESGDALLRAGEADAVLSMGTGGLEIAMLEPNGVKGPLVSAAVQEAAASLRPQGQLVLRYLYGDTGESSFNQLGYLLLGFISFFLIFIFAGISFVRERTRGTVERLMLTPVRTVSVVAGYVCGFAVFAVIQSLLLIFLAKHLFHLPFAGSWWVAELITLLIAIGAVMFGLLVSAVSKNEFQVMQFIPIVIIPQFFFMGIIPVDTLPYHMGELARIMPLYYGSLGLQEVMVYGGGLREVLPDILGICVFIAVLFGANMLAVKKYRAT